MLAQHSGDCSSWPHKSCRARCLVRSMVLMGPLTMGGRGAGSPEAQLRAQPELPEERGSRLVLQMKRDGRKGRGFQKEG